MEGTKYGENKQDSSLDGALEVRVEGYDQWVITPNISHL